MASGVDMAVPEPPAKATGDAVPRPPSQAELVSKHSYTTGQTPPNPDTTRQGEQPSQNANTFAAPKTPVQEDKPQPLPGLFKDANRVEWAVNDPKPDAAPPSFIRIIRPDKPVESPQPVMSEETPEPEEDENALGCSTAPESPDGGQGIGPLEMDWILALANGQPVPSEHRKALLRAIYNIRDTQIHQSLIESINGSDNRIATFLDEAEREANNADTASGGFDNKPKSNP